MFTIKKLIGFLMVCVLYTITPIKVFPVMETTNITLQAKVIPIFGAVESIVQLDDCVPFMVVFMFSDISDRHIS